MNHYVGSKWYYTIIKVLNIPFHENHYLAICLKKKEQRIPITEISLKRTATAQRRNKNFKNNTYDDTRARAIRQSSKKWGTYKVRNEIETKRNETKRNQRKRNETKRNGINKNETKRNESNEMKTK